MVDWPAPVSRMKGYGPWPPMHTSTVSATCPATTLTVSGTFSPPPGCAVAPLQPVPAGGRANVTCGSTWTVVGPVPGPLTSGRQDQHQHRDPDGHERDDEQTPGSAQRAIG